MCTSLSMLCRAALRSQCPATFSYIRTTTVELNQRGICLRRPVNISKTFFSQERFGSASAAASSGVFPGSLNKTQVKEFAGRLTTEQRDELISALQECQSQNLKDEYKGQLAAFRWRSKFGRPSKVPTLGDVDPTGSYCKVPDDWLLRKYVPKPCKRDLMIVSIANAIPFLGFGFLDNFIMIVAGDSIESAMGSYITLSTMAAAALGNTFSDILGIGSAYYIELLAVKIGFQPPKLTPIQLDLPVTRKYANFGRVVGVTIGCLLGMWVALYIVPVVFAIGSSFKIIKEEKGASKSNDSDKN
ncbi:hypothetical protein QAD02_015818 [Eretmocerus hayati]|uniref:Uncharacterized protein n=1 Tax=Eretmocerus hayati TaxID=131215 RepID=A0ACC2P9A3_9HYME|nr:hypothetical protein QAD02_015818 [Eretmocerus hayati]